MEITENNNKEITIQGIMSEIPAEKLEWLESVGFTKYESPVLGFLSYPDGNMAFSVKYLKNTNLDELQKEYKRHMN